MIVILLATLVPRALADDGADPPLEVSTPELDTSGGQPPELPLTDPAATGGEHTDGDPGHQDTAPQPPGQEATAQEVVGSGDGQLAAGPGRPGDPAGCAGAGCQNGPAIPVELIAAAAGGRSGEPGPTSEPEPEGESEAESEPQPEHAYHHWVRDDAFEGEAGDPWPQDVSVVNKIKQIREMFYDAVDSSFVVEGMTNVLRRIEGVAPELAKGTAEYDEVARLYRRAHARLRAVGGLRTGQRPLGGETEGAEGQRFSSVELAPPLAPEGQPPAEVEPAAGPGVSLDETQQGAAPFGNGELPPVAAPPFQAEDGPEDGNLPPTTATPDEGLIHRALAMVGLSGTGLLAAWLASKAVRLAPALACPGTSALACAGIALAVP
jgi:hypothetical protein